MARPDVASAEADGRQLLRADEDRLRLVATTLARGGRFVLVVADRDLWPTAARYLRDSLPDHAFVERAPVSSEDTSRAISDPLRDHVGMTIVLRVTGQDAGPIETLNLRRESLRKAAGNFLVVLEGDAAHGRFLREAPDCYSYRDLLVVLQGEPSFTPPERNEIDWNGLDAAVERARQEADPRTRADRLYHLARRLQRNNEMDRARKLLEEATAVMTKLEQALDEDERAFLAALYYHSANGCSRAECYRRVRRALDVLAPVADQYSAQFANIEGQMVDAIGVDLEAALDAVRRAREGRGGSIGRQLSCLAEAYWARENLVRARDVLAEIDVADYAIVGNSLTWISLQFDLLVEEGAWVKADQLVASAKTPELEEPMHRERLDRLRAMLLMRQGESRAAQRIFETLPTNLANELALIRIAADSGRMQDASTQVARMIDRPRTADGPDVDDLLAMHDLLLYLTEQEIAAGGSVLAREQLDARLAALRLHIERTEDPDPPWDMIRCLLLQADSYLERFGAERLAVPCAEQAWQLADTGASVLASRVARRLVVAAIRLGELDQARAWLDRGLLRAREHEHRGDEARLRGLALWHAALAGGDVHRAEVDMRTAIAATGSMLVEASVLARTGAALTRHDLLRRAQQIYRSLPWPAREGACLEALGEIRIAEVRYRSFGLVARSTILARRSGPPPITAKDSD